MYYDVMNQSEKSVHHYTDIEKKLLEEAYNAGINAEYESAEQYIQTFEDDLKR
tara:strand:- start:3436 stop:3594 length:159 start_codon:yes stop_codon:yes gene_type:complete